MNEMQVFRNPEFGSVRTIEGDGKVLFCASDVAKALGYARPNDAIVSHCRYTANTVYLTRSLLTRLLKWLLYLKVTFTDSCLAQNCRLRRNLPTGLRMRFCRQFGATARI